MDSLALENPASSQRRLSALKKELSAALLHIKSLISQVEKLGGTCRRQSTSSGSLADHSNVSDGTLNGSLEPPPRLAPRTRSSVSGTSSTESSNVSWGPKQVNCRKTVLPRKTAKCNCPCLCGVLQATSIDFGTEEPEPGNSLNEDHSEEVPAPFDPPQSPIVQESRSGVTKQEDRLTPSVKLGELTSSGLAKRDRVCQFISRSLQSRLSGNGNGNSTPDDNDNSIEAHLKRKGYVSCSDPQRDSKRQKRIENFVAEVKKDPSKALGPIPPPYITTAWRSVPLPQSCLSEPKDKQPVPSKKDNDKPSSFISKTEKSKSVPHRVLRSHSRSTRSLRSRAKVIHSTPKAKRRIESSFAPKTIKKSAQKKLRSPTSRPSPSAPSNKKSSTGTSDDCSKALVPYMDWRRSSRLNEKKSACHSSPSLPKLRQVQESVPSLGENEPSTSRGTRANPGFYVRPLASSSSSDCGGSAKADPPEDYGIDSDIAIVSSTDRVPRVTSTVQQDDMVFDRTIFEGYHFVLTQAKPRAPDYFSMAGRHRKYYFSETDGSSTDMEEYYKTSEIMDVSKLKALIRNGKGIVYDRVTDVNPSKYAMTITLSDGPCSTVNYVLAIAFGIRLYRFDLITGCIRKNMPLNKYLSTFGGILLSPGWCDKECLWADPCTTARQSLKGLSALVCLRPAAQPEFWKTVLTALGATVTVIPQKSKHNLSDYNVAMYSMIVGDTYVPSNIIKSAQTSTIPIVSTRFVLQVLYTGNAPLHLNYLVF